MVGLSVTRSSTRLASGTPSPNSPASPPTPMKMAKIIPVPAAAHSSVSGQPMSGGRNVHAAPTRPSRRSHSHATNRPAAMPTVMVSQTVKELSAGSPGAPLSKCASAAGMAGAVLAAKYTTATVIICAISKPQPSVSTAGGGKVTPRLRGAIPGATASTSAGLSMIDPCCPIHPPLRGAGQRRKGIVGLSYTSGVLAGPWGMPEPKTFVHETALSPPANDSRGFASGLCNRCNRFGFAAMLPAQQSACKSGPRRYLRRSLTNSSGIRAGAGERSSASDRLT
ncbi:hypothetical protein ERY430_41379 [Erythrobacter sp. EC-HK427]|nr:hypothetical protein ERY430_41379 [Erythrobacter sp. EC-HK427]